MIDQNSPISKTIVNISEVTLQLKGRDWQICLECTIQLYVSTRVMKWKKGKVAQLCPTLWDPMNYRVRGILQARILEWVAFPFSQGSSQPRDQTQVSCIAGGFFTSWATREAHKILRRGGKNTQKNYTKKIFTTKIIMMVWSFIYSQTS